MIIGFAGKAASGKTTAAKQMAPLLGENAQIIPMAMVLRDEVEQFLRQIGAEQFVPLVYGSQEDKVTPFAIDSAKAKTACPQWQHFIDEHADIQEKPDETAVTVRRLLQWWGTEYRRSQDPDYWTKAWDRKIHQYDLATTDILVDDIRFANELETLKADGGLIVKIERPGFNGAGNHASETSLDNYTDWDYTLHNDGTLEQFLDKVTALTGQLAGR